MGVTCATIMVSQLLIAGNLAKEKTADSVKKTAENDAGGNFQNGIYTGTGEGYRGKVTVTVKVADGKKRSLYWMIMQMISLIWRERKTGFSRR